MGDVVLKQEAIKLLKSLIAIPSFSKEEDKTADALDDFFQQKGIPTQRLENNLIVKNEGFCKSKPTILLNSHHDTVKPNSKYTRSPFTPTEKEGKIYGLGSNDAGGSLVALIASFLHFYKNKDLPYNLMLVASAEEEISGPKGMRFIYENLGSIEFALVGEPTNMQMAIAERGLLVLDGYTYGSAGHAAHGGENSIYKAMEDINWFSSYRFPKTSLLLGDVNMQVTQVNAGSQHNCMPLSCHYVVDIRVNNFYTNTEVLAVIDEFTNAEIKPRSTWLTSSQISKNHPIVKIGQDMGKQLYGSQTLSDQALMQCPSLKMGPGDTKRSHIANEFIYRSEIEKGIDDYIELLTRFFTQVKNKEINVELKEESRDETVG